MGASLPLLIATVFTDAPGGVFALLCFLINE